MDVLHGRPLLDVATDMDPFVERPTEMGGLAWAVRRGLNVLLVGEAGSGKTTLLRALMFRSFGLAPALVYVRAATADTAAGLLQLVLRELRGDPNRRAGALQDLHMSDLDARDLVAVLKGAVGGGPVTVLLDDVRPRPAHHLFGLLRDELWGITALHWVVAVRPSEAVQAAAPPADAFFEARADMGPMGAEQAQQLLATRLDPEAAEGMRTGVTPPEGLALTPRQILDVLRASGQGAGQVWEAAQGRAGLQTAAGALGRGEAMLFAELEALGPVALTDERLTDRLGWSTSRVRQVAQRLQQAGLIDHVAGHSSGPGRPPRLYHVAGGTRELSAPDASALAEAADSCGEHTFGRNRASGCAWECRREKPAHLQVSGTVLVIWSSGRMVPVRGCCPTPARRAIAPSS